LACGERGWSESVLGIPSRLWQLQPRRPLPALGCGWWVRVVREHPYGISASRLCGDEPLKVRAGAGNPGLWTIAALCGGGDTKEASALCGINSPWGN